MLWELYGGGGVPTNQVPFFLVKIKKRTHLKKKTKMGHTRTFPSATISATTQVLIEKQSKLGKTRYRLVREPLDFNFLVDPR